MNKLNKEQKEKVEVVREAVKKLQEAENLIYLNLVNEVGANDCSPIIVDDDWLYDYIFNCSEENDYTNAVRERIFE